MSIATRFRALTTVAFATLLLTLAAPPVIGDSTVLPQADPETVGMSAARLQRVSALMQRYVDDRHVAGAVTLVARHGQIVHHEAVGVADLDLGTPMAEDPLFRIYSMTKPVAAVATMILYEEGALQLSDPIAKFLPELTELEVLEEGGERVPAQPITVHHVLTHTAGFSYGFSPRDPVDVLYRESNWGESEDIDDFIERLATLPLRFQPGSRWHYSVANDVLGAIVERASGQRFDRFLEERLFRPLGMHDTFFDIPVDKRDRLGTNHSYDREQGRLTVLPTPNYPRWQDTTFFSGGAGLISTAADYARFAEMLRNGGALGDVRILSPKTVELMTMDHLPATVAASGSGENPGLTGVGGGRSGSGFGLGFGVTTDVPATQMVGSVGEFSWGGAAGTVFWVDPVEDLIVIGMIQLMQSPWPLRRELKALTYQALTELNNR